MTKNPSYFSTFKTWCKNGKSPWQCVQNIAKKQGCTETAVWNKLCKANLAFCKKFNGQSFFFPVDFHKGNSKTWKSTQMTFCWSAIEFCLQHGWCTPEQLYSWTPNQICWFTGQCIAKNFKKPAGFNANKSVKGFPMSWTGTMTTKSTAKKTTKTKKAKKSTTSKPKMKKSTKGMKTHKATKAHKGTKTYKFSTRKHTNKRRTRKAA